MKTQKQRLAAFLFAALVMVSSTLPIAAPRAANFAWYIFNANNPTNNPIPLEGALWGGAALGSLGGPVGTVIGGVVGF